MTDRLDLVTNEMLEYLDDLRESGETNMFGAASYVQATFGLTRKESRQVHVYWMETYGERHPSE